MGSFSVGRGAAFIYLELIVAAFSGYILWLLLSKLTTPDVIGTSSTIVSISTIFAAAVSMGIPNGIPRYLGKLFSEKMLEDARLFVKASILLTFLGILAGSVAILAMKDLWILNTMEMGLIILCILLMGSTSLTTLLRYIVISSLMTRLLVLRQTVSSSAKVVLSIALILIGLNALGLVAGYTIAQILAAVLLTVVIAKIIRAPKNSKPTLSFRQSCRSILSAGFPSWLPSTITMIGSQAGTIIVFGTSGASEAGTYFIAFSIFSAIFMITSSLVSAAFPALSAMKDGRKRYSWRIAKISLIISLPISCSFIFYSDKILGLLNQNYVPEAASLQILLLSILPTAVMTSVNTLVYAYGNYRQVMEIGLALSIPRAALYFLFVPFYSGVGAASSFTLGAVAGFIMSVSIARAVGLKVLWKELALLLATSMGTSFAISHLDIHYFFGIPLSLLATYLILAKLKIITRQDVQDSLGVLPRQISDSTIKVINIVRNRLGGFR